MHHIQKLAVPILLYCMQDRFVTMNSSYIELQLTTKSIKVIKFVNSAGVDILGNSSLHIMEL